MMFPLCSSLTRLALLTCLAAGRASLGADPAPAATVTPLVEAFQKGPITLTAQVARTQPGGGETLLPLFKVPVLRYQDRLELSFAGEAFDRRVTSADWSLIVVFLPRTVAPTEQGVVDYRLKRQGDLMRVPAISVPYDSIPMLFLVPDKGGRKKVLTDLSAHLQAFRTLCAKIADLSGERASADAFLKDLEAIDRNLSPAAYDNAVLSFLHAHGNQVSTDLQGFLNRDNSNLDKFQFLTGQFRKTNLLVPEAAAGNPVDAQVGVTATQGRAASAYVSIIFDLAAIVHNLWPGHQFQYLPALARNFSGASADLYYSDWVHTTGEVRGALMCCPGNWDDQDAPAFDLELPRGESILKKEALLKVHPQEKGRGPFALYGHGWKLLLSGPQGETLAPLPLTPCPARQGFLAAPGALQESLRKLGAPRVKARLVGNWGFTGVATGSLELPVAVDPAWSPSAQERADFQAGRTCSVALPAAWAAGVAKVLFRPAAAAPLTAVLQDRDDGGRLAQFKPAVQDAGPGGLEVYLFGSETAALTLPLTLLEPPAQISALEARQGDPGLILRGSHLDGIQAVLLGERRYLPTAAAQGELRAFRAEDGKVQEAVAGTALHARMLAKDGSWRPLEGFAVLAARPRLSEVRISPNETRGAQPVLSIGIPVAPTGAPSQLSLVAERGYRFPADRAFQVAFRNAEEPAEVRLVPAARIRVLGNSQKALLVLNPAELMGGRGSGRLEVQVQDPRAGASDWWPVPATFVDLPTLGALRAVPGGALLSGPSLDQIEAVALAADGPWEKFSVSLEGGLEVASLPPAPSGAYWFKLFGWPELVWTLKAPAPQG